MKGKIAFEEHFSTPETLIDSERPHGTSEIWPTLKHNLLDMQETRIAKMDKLGIEVAVLSLNAPVLQAMSNTKESIELAIRSNDFLANEMAKNPKRFQAFAALPMQDPEASAKELTRCVKELGFVGALVNGYTERDKPGTAYHYDLKEYWPFWEQVEKLDVPFYLHPRDLSRKEVFEGHPWLLTAAWSFGVETSTHALRLICSGLFDRYPKLQIIMGHLGEGLPFSVWRADHRIEKDPRGIPIKKKVGDYFRQNFYVTTSGNFHTQSLLDTMWEIGTDRILFASDFPFEEMEDAANWFDGCDINEYDKRKIGRENAIKLLKLEKALSARA
jgi:2,3-dihydroxybenzoate decarboxylase